jgi:hypothetical protein
MRSSGFAMSVPAAMTEGILIIEHQPAAHAAGEIQHDVDTGIANPRHHLAKMRRIPAALAGRRIAHVDVHRGWRPPWLPRCRPSAICGGVTGTPGCFLSSNRRRSPRR